MNTKSSSGGETSILTVLQIIFILNLFSGK